MKDIIGYEGLYSVTKDGRVWSHRPSPHHPKGGWLSFNKCGNKKQYLQVHLSKNNGTRAILVHRLVAQTYIPNPKNKPCVNHKNANTTDNRVENLEWMTYLENNMDTINGGRRNTAKGEDAPGAILTERQVIEIRSKYQPGVYTRRMLANEYGITIKHVESLIYNKIWKHIA